MSRHDDQISVRQMLDHAREAAHLVAGLGRPELQEDRTRLLALLQLLQITGEAARRVSAEFRAQHPEIPWAGFIGLRNRLIHGYDAVDYDALWKIVAGDLPPLIQSLQELLPAGPPE